MEQQRIATIAESKNESSVKHLNQVDKNMQTKEETEHILKRAKYNPVLLSQTDYLHIQRLIGNQAVLQLLKDADILNRKSKLPDMKEENKTGLPDDLKKEIENFSGLSMDNVNVHYNSNKPRQVHAMAYTKGRDIFIGSGQERHLNHEAWHVVQQMQGRVKPTIQNRDLKINNDSELENEADRFVSKSMQMGVRHSIMPDSITSISTKSSNWGQVLQGKWIETDDPLGLKAEGWQYWKPEEKESGPQGWYRQNKNGQYEQYLGSGIWQLTERGLELSTEDDKLEELNDIKMEDLKDEKKEDLKDEKKEDLKDEKEKTKKPRTRKYHSLSEGESDSEDPDIVYRSLRKDEKPFEEGLLPPKNFDPSITASAHITSGSKAKKKSGWVSTSRSIKVAGGWASESNHRVAKARIPKEKRKQDVYDLTNPEQAKKVFPSGIGSSLNTAKGSQEVVIFGGLGSNDIMEEFEANTLSVKKYEEIKKEMEEKKESGEKVLYEGKEVHTVFRTRTKTTGKPKPRILTKIPKPKKKTPPSPVELNQVLPKQKEDDLTNMQIMPILNKEKEPETQQQQNSGIDPNTLIKAIKLEDDSLSIDKELLQYVISQAKSLKEAVFLYTDLTYSMQ